MDYTISQLAKLAGVSSRTLRFYDQQGLLKPKSIRSNGYRIYGEKEVERLQQILFYRELGVELEEIGKIITAPGYEVGAALAGHLVALRAKRAQLDRIIDLVERTLGGEKMSDREKFEAFKAQKLQANEEQFGEEIRRKYGEAAVQASNAKFQGLTEADFARGGELELAMAKALASTLATGNFESQAAERGSQDASEEAAFVRPSMEAMLEIAQLHKEWLMLYWPEYSAEAHVGLAEMYLADERFTAYYERFGVGATQLLHDAIVAFCKDE